MMTKDVESFSDFIQYYQTKYIKSRTDPHMMYYIHGPTDHEKRRLNVRLYKDGRQAGDRVMDETAVWDEMQFGLPTIGMTVFNDAELMYLYYRTSRNGGRGFGIDRVVQHSFNGWILNTHGMTKLRADELALPVNAWLALTPRHVSLQTAWEDFNTEQPNRLAYALSNKFGVFLSTKENPTLCYKMFEIGDVLGPNKVRLKQQHAEFKDLVYRVINRDMEIEIQ